jgi:signal transduction histidine kinase
MRLGIKGKQVIYVTSIVGAFVVILSVIYLAQLAQVSLNESYSRADAVANQIFNRAHEVGIDQTEPFDRLRNDPGLLSILASSLYFKSITFAAIVDTTGAIVAADPLLGRDGTPLPPGEQLDTLLARPALSQLRAVYSSQGQNLEVRQALRIGDREIGSIRIGVSTLLIRDDLSKSLRPTIVAALVALTLGVFTASLLAQLILRPIHVLQSGLSRLGRGEFGVRLNLDQDDEFGDLGTFFNTASAQLSADRTQMAGQVANLESAVEHLEDAVAVVSPKGDLLFANPALRTLLPGAATGQSLYALIAPGHPLRRLFDETLSTRQPRGPVSLMLRTSTSDDEARRGSELGERLMLTHPVNDASGELVGIMIIGRNLEYLGQVQSTLRYSRKLAALGRLSAGVAHEVKNPLNAMMIHLELLRQQFAPRPAAVAHGGGRSATTIAAADAPPAGARDTLEHLEVIAGEIRRLDEVVQGFLKFTRPEDLKLQPVQLTALFGEVVPIVQPEADRNRVELKVECDNVPDVNADPTMLRQAFLNLALNACQAMPNGGTLRIRCESARGRRVATTFTDTGVGIKPEHLSRIFDLYYTTKPKGSGIGLSMVYRTIQMHDGEIEVQSTPGAGTTFKILLPQA